MKIYIAARFRERAMLETIAQQIVNYGHIITSRWLWQEEDSKADPAVYALRDLEDIDKADLLILNTIYPLTDGKGGREVEFGYAFARGKEIWVVGPNLNIFHKLITSTFEDWDEVLEELDVRYPTQSQLPL